MTKSRSEQWFYGINYFLLFLAGLSCLFPLMHIISISLSDNTSILSGKVTIWPVGWTLESFDKLFAGTPIMASFMNSVQITIFGVIFCLVFTVLAAYPLSRPYFYARKQLTLAIVFTMLFTGGLIPTYLVVKATGLLDTYWGLWIPFLISPFNMLIMKNFFENLPKEMDEAARMDGCGEVRYIVQIVLPLSKPMLATIALFYGVFFWNLFLQVLIFIHSTEKYNLTVLVQNMIRSQSVLQEMNYLQPEDIKNMTPEGIKASGIVVMVIPMLVVYPFLQKYFVRGVMIGAIKG